MWEGAGIIEDEEREGVEELRRDWNSGRVAEIGVVR